MVLADCAKKRHLGKLRSIPDHESWLSACKVLENDVDNTSIQIICHGLLRTGAERVVVFARLKGATASGHPGWNIHLLPRKRTSQIQTCAGSEWLEASVAGSRRRRLGATVSERCTPTAGQETKHNGCNRCGRAPSPSSP